MKRSHEMLRRPIRVQIVLSLVAAALFLIVALGHPPESTRNVLFLGAALAGINIAILTTLRRR